MVTGSGTRMHHLPPVLQCHLRCKQGKSSSWATCKEGKLGIQQERKGKRKRGRGRLHQRGIGCTTSPGTAPSDSISHLGGYSREDHQTIFHLQPLHHPLSISIAHLPSLAPPPLHHHHHSPRPSPYHLGSQEFKRKKRRRAQIFS